MSESILISAFGGDRYYHKAAERLVADCERLDIPHDVVEWDVGDSDWLSLCRRKVGFYRQMLEKHGRSVFWVDVDTRIIRRPTSVLAATTDFGAVLKNFAYLREFDPFGFTRAFIPAFLHFGHTDAAFAFLETMEALEASSPEVEASDEYFLQEAWSRHQEEMTITLFPPKLFSMGHGEFGEAAAFVVGLSGWARPFARKSVQHERPVVGAASTIKLLRRLGKEARQAGDVEGEGAFRRVLKRMPLSDQDAANTMVRALGAQKIGKMRRRLIEGEGSWSPPFVAKRAWLDHELEGGDIAVARRLCDELAASSDKGDRRFAASRAYRLDLEDRANRLGLGHDERPKLWWIQAPEPGNLGDILGPYVVEKLSGRPPLFTRSGKAILSIGSIISKADSGMTVWGSGAAYSAETVSPEATYRAVRGPLTREAVLASGGSCEPIFGDPAWFLPQLYRPKVEKRYRLGLIRHYVHRARPIALDGVLDTSVVRVGDSGIESFVDEVCSCEAIISTSLHGLIIAHAYGIPAEFATFDDGFAGLLGDGTKLADYLASVGLEPRDPLDLAGRDRLAERDASDVTLLPAREIDLDALVGAAPFPVRDDWRISD